MNTFILIANLIKKNVLIPWSFKTMGTLLLKTKTIASKLYKEKLEWKTNKMENRNTLGEVSAKLEPTISSEFLKNFKREMEVVMHSQGHI